jgi:hypothetical protein
VRSLVRSIPGVARIDDQGPKAVGLLQRGNDGSQLDGLWACAHEDGNAAHKIPSG